MSEETPKKKKRWKVNWTTDKIMSTSALFISVISLIALLYQSYLAREENKLIQKQQSASVLPHLNQWYSDLNGNFKVIIGNKGVGPAFIKDVNIVLDSKKSFDNTDDFFVELFNSSPTLDSVQTVTSTFVKGFVLPANESINVIEIYGKQSSNAFKEVFSTRSIDFEILYEDIYGTQWLLTNKEDQENMPVLVESD
ncbi:hypothetical protein AB9K26_08510 [Psychroserpens sp. XS_ASV72]|uniref:hypothetical protein n=1 Tax=Psychroserpens sp. XS_ASV72 TaxID=3241293 RepID=UPI00351735C1